MTASSSICVIGRCSFQSGIGGTTYAACELLSRSYEISIFPTEFHYRELSEILLPSGTRVPVCKDLSRVQVVFYTDVLWNGAHDFNHTLIPPQAFRVAHIAWDSDEFLPQWVEIMNERLDFALFMNKELEEVALNSGVRIGIGTLPLALDIEPLLSRRFKPPTSKKVKYLSIAAFHTRKGIEALVDAFLEVFGNNGDSTLTLHSNLAIGDCLEGIKEKIRRSESSNIIISNQPLSEKQKNELLEECDVFVNCSKGEGFSIGPREALALGKTLVITDVGGHRDLHSTPGVFLVPASIAIPARYPEIDNLIAGRQFEATIADIKAGLEAAFDFVSGELAAKTARTRKKLAEEFSFSRLASNYAQIVDFDAPTFRPALRSSKYTRWPKDFSRQQTFKLGPRGQHLPHKNRTVIQSHDGGFFSVFNIFMSHLVWDQREARCHMVLPDWNISRMLARHQNKPFISFCYGKPEDGNIWNRLFEPLYGLTPEQMDDPEFIYSKGMAPEDFWNEKREPNLTYVHAYQLYRSGQFRGFRRQYHSTFKQHIRLLPQFQAEIDEFTKSNFGEKFMIAAHVKHPSHVIEQPGGSIANTESYVRAIRVELEKRGIDPLSSNWGIFLATDQDRVVEHFKSEFGSRVSFYGDVRRTREHEDAHFDSLSKDEQSAEGFQVQHLVAANRANWSTRMAWEVIRDAMTMAKCNILLHIVSNVSTAVSYFNPDIELVFCDPRAAVGSRSS